MRRDSTSWCPKPTSKAADESRCRRLHDPTAAAVRSNTDLMDIAANGLPLTLR
jgi:hypothetical protein